jgi:hypothetical protein
VRLTKEQSRARWAALRDLWCKWDPIGVMALPDWPRDEYDAYLGPTLRLLEAEASLEKIASYLAEVELGRMGLNDTLQALEARRVFAGVLQEWYARDWPATSV